MTIKDKLQSMRSTGVDFYTRLLNYQGIDFKISPLDYLAIYGTKSDFDANKPIIRVPLNQARDINQSLLDYKFDYFVLQRRDMLDSNIDLVFILNYQLNDNSNINMNVKFY